MLTSLRTPLVRLGNLFPGREVYAKCELLAPSGCFKVRGAAHLLERGLGNTNLVNRATVRADELRDDELRAGRLRLEAFVARHRPRVLAVAGVTAYRTAFRRPRARVGCRDSSSRPGWRQTDGCTAPGNYSPSLPDECRPGAPAPGFGAPKPRGSAQRVAAAAGRRRIAYDPMPASMPQNGETMP